MKNKSIYFIIKRLFDLLVGILGITLLIPMTIIIKLLNIINKDYKSIFYTHKRVGKNGKVFKLYKFRTMVPNADKKLEEILNSNEIYKKQWQQNQKLDNDPRITNVGKILRKLSLDEFAQFINIIKGDMSLIGPRPLILDELDNHNGNHKKYESVKPGLTGWWACNGRNAIDYEKRLDLEYYYVENCSFMLDVKIIFKTIKIVLQRKGAI